MIHATYVKIMTFQGWTSPWFWQDPHEEVSIEKLCGSWDRYSGRWLELWKTLSKFRRALLVGGFVVDLMTGRLWW